MDDKYYIQGMSSSLIQKFGINNNIFQKDELPFYLICKKFVNFYSIFLDNSKKKEENDDLIDANHEKKE